MTGSYIVQQRRDSFSDSVGSTPAEFAAFLDAECAKRGAVIKRPACSR